jgi:AcrR family transcriptional regulator
VEVSHRRPRLTPEAVVAAAMAVADAEGLDAVSLRRVAAELDARTMTLYSHIANKVELLDLMFDELAAEILAEGPLPAGWRPALTELAGRKRRLCRRHPWAVPLYTQFPRLGPRMLRLLEESVAAVAELTPDPLLAWRLVNAVDDYTLGYVVREASGLEAHRRYGLTPAEWDVSLRQFHAGVVARGDLPHLAAVIAAADPDGPPAGLPTGADFEDGLAGVLDGLAARLTR